MKKFYIYTFVIFGFFVIGIVMLFFTNIRQAIRDAGNEVPAVV